MVTVKQVIPVYRHSEHTGTLVFVSTVTIGVESATDERFVVLVCDGGQEFAVRADDLRTAIGNAVNTSR